MKRLIIGASIFFSLFLFPSFAHAIDYCPGGQFNPLCQLRGDDYSVVPRNIFNILLVGAVLLSLFFLIYGGIKWIMSGGDKGKVDAARGTITAAIIGLIISFLAFTIIGMINYFFGLTGGTIFVLPQLNSDARPAVPTAAPGSGGGGCFLAGTQILLADGSYKRIEDVKQGDVVTSYNLKTRASEKEKVDTLIIHPNFVEKYLLINAVLKVTTNHPIWVNNEHAWINAGSLKIGDKLLNPDGKEIIVQTISEIVETKTVYNLHLLGENHNYFADDILVHNK